MSLPYVFRRALKGMRESPFGAAVATATIALALFAVGSLGAAGAVAARALSSWGRDLELTVYLDDAATPAERAEVSRRLAALGEPSSEAPPRLLDKRQALAALRQSLGDVGPVLDDLPENPLRDAVVRPVPSLDPARLAALAGELRALPGVADVDDGSQWIGPAVRLLAWLRRAGLALFGVVVATTVILVSNTFRLAVYARRDEIGILKLVGATDSFVRLPFLVEGLIEGSLGGSFASLALGGAWLWAWPRAAVAVPLLASLGASPLPLGRLLAGIATFGALLGLAASGLSVGRFLEV